MDAEGRKVFIPVAALLLGISIVFLPSCGGGSSSTAEVSTCETDCKTVSGKAQDSNSNNITNEKVTYTESSSGKADSGSGGNSNAAKYYETTTDGSGDYTINLSQGDYTMSISGYDDVSVTVTSDATQDMGTQTLASTYTTYQETAVSKSETVSPFDRVYTANGSPSSDLGFSSNVTRVTNVGSNSIVTVSTSGMTATFTAKAIGTATVTMTGRDADDAAVEDKKVDNDYGKSANFACYK